ncbi:MAG: GNAT family N-acetyltransferase [Gammaproteobacteria bacterium]|nr:GNAT family N-acetyltransferase [Gammaproteobacteria bacterium]
MKQFSVRPATVEDAAQLTHLLNEIIVIGGTTAFEEPLTSEELCHRFINGDHCLACFVCEANQGELLGFQSLGTLARLPEGWVDIATFARVSNKVRGVGSSLFEMSRQFCVDEHYAVINATIRADNSPGLGYYSKMGFVDYDVAQGVPLNDGTPMDRISKRFDI